jgi:hypothetical protein
MDDRNKPPVDAFKIDNEAATSDGEAEVAPYCFLISQTRMRSFRLCTAQSPATLRST